MTPQPITIDSRTGVALYVDDNWQPVPPDVATRAHVLFDDGGSAFYMVGTLKTAVGNEHSGNYGHSGRPGEVGGSGPDRMFVPQLAYRAHVTPEEFIAARDASKRSGYLSPLTPDDLKGAKLYLTHDGKIGGMMTKNGDMGNLFNNGGPKGQAAEVLLQRIHDGGKTSDCFDGYLPTLYANFGLVETGRMKFNKELAPPGWNYERDHTPDVVFLAVSRDATHQAHIGTPDAIRERVYGPRERWTPHLENRKYYDDFDAGKRDASAYARRAISAGRRSAHEGDRLRDAVRREHPGAGESVRRSLATRRPENAVHAAADRHLPSLTVAVRYALARARQAVSHTSPAKSRPAVVSALKAALLDVLLPTLTKIVVAGGDAGVKILTERLRAAGDVVGHLRSAAGPTLKMRFDASNPDVVAWAKAHAAELAAGISETTDQAIKDAVSRAVDEGDLDMLYDDINNAIGDETRAELIARTEVMRAANEGQRQSWDQAVEDGLLSGNEQREWIATGDDGVCPICDELDGQTTGLDGQYPGEGEDGPPAHPRCRCTEGLSAQNG